MLTNPPKGNNLKAYLVSFPCFFHIVGPNPIANSLTLTLHNFATVKCPNSWIKIRNPNKIIIFIADNIKVTTLPPIIIFHHDRHDHYLF